MNKRIIEDLDAAGQTPASAEPAPNETEGGENANPESSGQTQSKADENWERLLRATADFENFKKRASREKQEAIKFANENLLQRLIPVLDNFDMAVAAAQNAPGSGQSLQTGINMIHQQLKSALAEAGLEEIDATGKIFDPNLHEAVAHNESNAVTDGHVLQQMRKGYKLKDRLLRPATVVVAKKPSA